MGQVFDPAGALVPSATVTATSTSTGLTRTAMTTSAGVYTFAALPPSVYTITAAAPGFETVTRRNITLNIAATLPQNFTLAVAGTTASVDVADVTASPVETDSFQLSTVIDARQINNLPLILRDPYQLVLLSPGVVTATNNVGGFSVNGQRDRNNNFMLDGADNNDTAVPGTQQGISAANPDSTQEFRVITNNFDAEFGRNTGAVIDVLTRGGSNQYHGDAYEFGRYSALGARDFFNKKENGPQDPYVRNEFGASLGGPLLKDRTFFFLNAEVQRFRTTRTAVQTTPTAAFRTGQFTYTDPTDGSQTPVDLTGDPLANPDNYAGLGQDPTISRILALAPVGQADNGDGVSSTYFFPSPDNLNSYSLTGRLDHKLTDKHQLTLRYIYGHAADSNPLHDEALPGYGNLSEVSTSHNGVISLASSLSVHATNLFRGSYNQHYASDTCNHAAIDSITGTDGIGNGRDIIIPYFFTFGCFADSNGQARLSSTLLFADTFTFTKGAHSMKFGGEYRSVKDNNFENFGSRNLLQLDNFTIFGYPSYAFYGDHQSPSAQGFEDLIWGAQGAVANSGENQFFTGDGVRRANDLGHYRQHEWAAFAQDTWKVNSRLTAILGLRYAFNGVPYEKDGNLATLLGDASAPVPAAGFFTFTPVGPGTGHQLYANNWGLVEPRVGFAYDVYGNGKLAIRGGYGIFHDRVFDNLFSGARSNPPFLAQVSDYLFDGTPGTPTVNNLAFPDALTPSPNVGDGQLLYAPPVIDPHLKMPTSQAYNLGIQQQLNRQLTFELNYVGSHTTHALRALDGAPPQPGLVQAAIAAGVLPEALTYTSLYLGGTDANGTSFGPMVNNTAFYHEILETSIAHGIYNALQARLTGQMGGLTFTGSYTWSHSLDNGSDPIAPGAGNNFLPRNSFNLGPEYGNSDFDVRQRGTLAATYSLPVGIGSAHLNHGLAGHIFEGLQLSGIQQAQTGLPFDLRGTTDSLHTDAADRPELVGEPYPSGRGTIVASGKITGPALTAFANEPYGQSVSIHRNKFYGPGLVDTDLVFQKTQTLYEQVKLVFRAESYNVFNHPNLNSPSPTSLTIDSPTFGVSQSEVSQNDNTTGSRQIQGAVKVIF
jgi:hypothetical protein